MSTKLFQFRVYPWLRFFTILALSMQSYSLAQLTITAPSGDSLLVCSGSNFDFQVIGNNGSIRWEWNLGSDFHPISDDLAGLNDQMSTLALSNISLSWDETQIRVREDDGGNIVISDTILLLVGDSPDGFSNIATPDGQEFCASNPINLRLNAAGGNNGKYDITRWYKGNTSGNPISEGSNQISVSETGTFIVRREGCEDGPTRSVDIESAEPDNLTGIELAGPTQPCLNDVIILTANGGSNDVGETIKWYDNDNPLGTEIGEGESISLTFTQAFTAYARREGCGNTPFVSISINPPPTPDMPTNIQRSKENPLCNGESVTLSVQDQPAAPDAKWQWFDNPGGSGNPLAETEDFTTPALSVGTTSFYVAQVNRCQDRSGLNQVEVDVIAGPAAAFVGLPDTVCVGFPQLFLADSVQGSTPGSYAWSFGNNANPTNAQGLGPHSVSYTQTGNQTVSLSSEGQGCSSEIEKEITVVSAPVLTIDGEPLAQEYQVASGVESQFELGTELGSAMYAWTWTVDSGRIEGSQSGSGSGAILDQIWTIEEGSELAVIEVEVSVSGFCDSIFQFRILVQNLIFVADLLTPNGDSFNDTWGITLSDGAPQPGDFSIQLYNRQGICVCGCGESFSVSDAQNWSGADLPSGAYWYLIQGPANFSQRGSLTILR